MTGLKLFTDFPFGALERQSEFVDQAEHAGYSGVLATENRHDAFLPVAAAARRNRSIHLGVAVIALLAHHPFTVAQMAWDLHFNSGEKFILGVCAHQDVHLKARLGITPRDKHNRVVEAVETIREIWACWLEEREPRYSGRFYSIDVCPPGYRPTTQLTTLPDIYLLCAEDGDLRVAPQIADGIFTHPTWTPRYIDAVVRPAVTRNAHSWRNPAAKIIAGSLIVTGAKTDQRAASRHHARERIGCYWMRGTYDEVYRVAGVSAPVARFREEAASGIVDWNAPYLQALYEVFVCDAAYADLAVRLKDYHAGRVDGLFPNIMSAIPRLLPADLVADIQAGTASTTVKKMAPV